IINRSIPIDLTELSADFMSCDIGIFRAIPIVYIAIKTEITITVDGVPKASTISKNKLLLNPKVYRMRMTIVAVTIKITGNKVDNALIPKEGVSLILNVFALPIWAILPSVDFTKADGINFLAYFVKSGPVIITVGIAIIKP